MTNNSTNAHKRNKRLMKDMLRYPAKTFFRDEHIAIVQPADEQSYEFWTPVITVSGYSRRQGDYSNVFIVRANNKEYFEVRKSASHTRGGGFQFGESAFLDSFVPKGEFATIKTYKRSIKEYLKRYPSLYDAFEEMAIKMAFLPMIRQQTDEIVWAALEADISNLKYVENLTHKRKLKILERWPSAISSMGQTQELAEFVVKQDAANISYVDEHFRTQALCEKAVARYAPALQYVPTQTEKICLAAIRRDAMMLKYIKQPTMKMYVAAVNRSPNAWNLIKKDKLRREVKKAKKQKKYQT